MRLSNDETPLTTSTLGSSCSLRCGDLDPVGGNDVVVRSASDEHDGVAVFVELRRDRRADGARSDDHDSHESILARRRDRGSRVLESSPVRWPNAEVEMNAALVEELVRQQHPDLLSGPLREMPPGFDNTIWRLGDDLVVRLPRREVGVRLIESEQRWLPELAARLPLLIPAPLRVGCTE